MQAEPVPDILDLIPADWRRDFSDSLSAIDLERTLDLATEAIYEKGVNTR